MKNWTDNTPHSDDELLDVIPVVPDEHDESPAVSQRPHRWARSEGYELIPVLILSLVLLMVVGGGLIT